MKSVPYSSTRLTGEVAPGGSSPAPAGSFVVFERYISIM